MEISLEVSARDIADVAQPLPNEGKHGIALPWLYVVDVRAAEAVDLVDGYLLDQPEQTIRMGYMVDEFAMEWISGHSVLDHLDDHTAYVQTVDVVTLDRIAALWPHRLPEGYVSGWTIPPDQPAVLSRLAHAVVAALGLDAVPTSEPALDGVVWLSRYEVTERLHTDHGEGDEHTGFA